MCDNLKTHALARLYAAFPAVEAHRLARRLEIHPTPRNGSWLHVAAIERSVSSRQCLDRRIGSITDWKRELVAWPDTRNANQAAVRWRLTTSDARIRLRHVYPQF